MEGTVRVLLAAVPQGLADTQIRTMLDEELGNKAPGEADVSLLRSLFTKVHFEVDRFLKDTTLATIAKNLGATEDDVGRPSTDPTSLARPQQRFAMFCQRKLGESRYGRYGRD